MTRRKPPPRRARATSAAPIDELGTLIATLHETDERLDALTGGQVDAVADPQGRTFLLRRAQDRLRQSEAAKQGAILNALPAHIALLDTQGRVVSVNEAWQRFATANGLQGPRFAIGVDYLDVCERADGDDASQAQQAANGIRGVLSGTHDSFLLEYSCHSPLEQRWFLLTVTPLGSPAPTGVVLMHLDITERKRQEEALQRFRAAMDVTADAIYLVDRSTMRFTHVNDTACRMQQCSREELLALGPSGLQGIPHAELERIYDAVIAADAPTAPVEVLRPRPDGTERWVELRRHAQRDGDRWMIVTLVRDITEQRNAMARIVHLNRVYAMLHGINALIVRAHTREELFTGACRVAVDAGGFRMAWVGLVDREQMKIVPVASVGVAESMLAIVKNRTLDEAAKLGNMMSARALREKKPVVSNDARNDPNFAFGAQHAAASVRSVAVLPLVVADESVGVLVLYAAEIDFFHAEELALLTALAGDIGFGIDHIQKQERLDYLAYYDVLTGLANRSLFLERLGQHTRNAAAAGQQLAVFLIDLERFKNLNDSLGEAAGDSLLRQVAAWLGRRVGDVSLLARVGGDRFAVVLPVVRRDGDVAHLLERAMEAFQEHPFRLNDALFRIACKAGGTLFPDDGTEPDVLYRNAEAALKKAKAGGDRYLLYTQKMTAEVAGKLTLENQLRRALDEGQFVLHYQPKVSLQSGAMTSAEALIRWNDPRTGLVPPNRFIPVLEETGLIKEVGRWAMRKAVEDYLRWLDAGLPSVRIAVNVSPLQLRDRGFIADIRQCIGVDPRAAAGLELEITESLIMADVEHSIGSLLAIRAMAVRIAIDDFGTGFSSLSYLAKLPVDTLKIDRSFVTAMTQGAQGLALVSTIVDLGHSLKLKVVAEGVETEEQSSLLRLLGCDEMQGFLFSRPVAREAFEAGFLAPQPVRA